LDGDWTFEAAMEVVPLTWTMEATFDGGRGTGHIVWYYDGELGGEAWTAIRDILVTDDSVYFHEGGCDYLLTLRDPNHMSGDINCRNYFGTVEATRERS
jgi:hypothetical protein